MRDIHDGDDISGLILRVSLRDRAAFDRLYQATGPKLFGTCLRILRNKAEAEEAVQEVFVKIWLKADRFSVTGQSPMSWLIAIARNQAIDRLRMRRDVTGGIDDAALDIRDPAPPPRPAASRAPNAGNWTAACRNWTASARRRSRAPISKATAMPTWPCAMACL